MSESSKGQFVSNETKKKLSDMRKGKKKTKEHIEKIRQSNMGKLSGEKHPSYGKSRSQDTKDKISRNRRGKCSGSDHPLYGKQRSQQVRDKISKSNSGRKPSENTILAIKKANTGRVPSDETRKRISIAHTGKKLSEETKEKLSRINSVDNKKFIVRKDENIIGVWNSIKKCARDLDLSKTSLRRYVFGEYYGKAFKGYSFSIVG